MEALVGRGSCMILDNPDHHTGGVHLGNVLEGVENV